MQRAGNTRTSNMARLRFKNSRPPRGFWYIQPETRLKIEGEDYGALMKLVMAHRQYKGLPRQAREEVQEDVERQICSRLTLAECRSEGDNDILRPVHENQVLSLGAVMGFTKSAFSWLASGAKVVDMAKLKKRQDTCLACPLNAPQKGCSCSAFYKTINALVPAERRHQDLHVCAACGCGLNAKVQMPIEMVLNADDGRDIQYAIGCWVTEEACVTQPKPATPSP